MVYNSKVIDIAKSYRDYHIHAQAGEIIQAHSENKRDIREVVRNEVDWNNVRRMLDLGCGYGWFEEGLGARLSLLVGLDRLEENGPPFLRNARRISRKTIFRKAVLPEQMNFPSDCFHLIVCAYALYFFPAVLPEVRRCLRKDGTFVVITHSESMLEEGKRFFDFKNLRKVIENFSSECGEAILRRYFSDVKSVDYANALVFKKGEEKDLIDYIDFKKEFIRVDVDPGLVRETMVGELSRSGEIRLNKNDRIFLVKK